MRHSSSYSTKQASFTALTIKQMITIPLTEQVIISAIVYPRSSSFSVSCRYLSPSKNTIKNNIHSTARSSGANRHWVIPSEQASFGFHFFLSKNFISNYSFQISQNPWSKSSSNDNNHVFKHSSWIHLIEPVHLQGEISWFSGVSGSKQILQANTSSPPKSPILEPAFNDETLDSTLSLRLLSTNSYRGLDVTRRALASYGGGCWPAAGLGRDCWSESRSSPLRSIYI